MSKRLPPLHPGEVLRLEFIEPLDLSAGKVAKAIGVPRTRIERIVDEKTGITGDTAIRLGKFFRTTPAFWMNLQTTYELQLAREKLAREVEKIEPVEMARADF